MDLALHPIANFPIQRLTASSAKYKLVRPHCLVEEMKGTILQIYLKFIHDFLFLFLSPKFLRLFDELVQGVEAILAAGHMGVIVQLAESCAESEERQDEMMQCLLRVSLNACLLLSCKGPRNS